MSVLEQAIAVGAAFQPMSEEERRTLLAKVELERLHGNRGIDLRETSGPG